MREQRCDGINIKTWTRERRRKDTNVRALMRGCRCGSPLWRRWREGAFVREQGADATAPTRRRCCEHAVASTPVPGCWPNDADAMVLTRRCLRNGTDATAHPRESWQKNASARTLTRGLCSECFNMTALPNRYWTVLLNKSVLRGSTLT